MSRGGNRPGAGRKPIPWVVRMQIGMFCESRLLKIVELQTLARHDARAVVKKIRKQQSIALGILQRARGQVNTHPHALAAAIDALVKPAAEIKRLGRVHELPTRRPKGFRSQILKEAVREFGKFGVTADIADTCWKRWRELQRKLQQSFF